MVAEFASHSWVISPEADHDDSRLENRGTQMRLHPVCLYIGARHVSKLFHSPMPSFAPLYSGECSRKYDA